MCWQGRVGGLSAYACCAFVVGKAHLAHGRPGSASQSYHSTPADLIGEFLGLYDDTPAVFGASLNWSYG